MIWTWCWRGRRRTVSRRCWCSADAAGSRAAHALALAHPGRLFATAGVHPHHASDFDADTEGLLRELQAQPQVKAVGETGLDYDRNFPRARRSCSHSSASSLAIEYGKPCSPRQRDAHADVIACMDNVRDRIGAAVVHCFTGEKQELSDYLDRGFHIGITGWICDERRGTHLRELVRHIPVDRLMLETDAPYLLPRNVRPMPAQRRNEPMYLAHICVGWRATVARMSPSRRRTRQYPHAGFRFAAGCLNRTSLLMECSSVPRHLDTVIPAWSAGIKYGRQLFRISRAMADPHPCRLDASIPLPG